MKVFISWSGDRSRMVAEALRDWLPDVINAVEPFISTDIEKGSVGLAVIAASLDNSAFGIVCLTPENQHRPWINYEGGALSKTVGDDVGRVATLLVGIGSVADLTGPLAQFQATRLEREDVKSLVYSIELHTDKPRPRAKVDSVVDLLWPTLERNLVAAINLTAQENPPKPARPLDEKIDEVLSLLRQLQQRSSRPSERGLPLSKSAAKRDILLMAELVLTDVFGDEYADRFRVTFHDDAGILTIIAPEDELPSGMERDQLRTQIADALPIQLRVEVYGPNEPPF